MGNTIPDIPRVYTALAEWLSCGMFMLLIKPKLSWGKLILLGLGYLAALVLFMELTATITLWLWIPCMLAAFFSMVCFLCLSTKTSIYEGIYYGVLAFSIAECMASLEWQLVRYVYADVSTMPLWIEILFLIGVYGAFMIVMWKLVKLRTPMEKRLHISKKDWVTALFIGVIVFGFSNLSFMTVETPFSGQYSREIANVRTLVDIAGIAILYAHFVSCCENMVKRELEAVQNVLQSQYQQYMQSRESIDLINMKYHDLKHQIHFLREEQDPAQRNAFLDRMEEDIKAYELQNKTGNSVLDTLLTSKSMYCSKHGITLTSVVDGKLLSFMDTMDICSIFGNALDNAIESVLTISDPEKRLIHVTVAQVKSFVMIRIENYYEGKLQVSEGDFVTTKKNKEFHGYGLKSIRYTANRYDGVLNIKAENRWFELKILIPSKAAESASQK